MWLYFDWGLFNDFRRNIQEIVFISATYAVEKKLKINDRVSLSAM